MAHGRQSRSRCLLRGIRDTEDAEAKDQHDAPELVQALHRAGTLQDLPAALPVKLEAEDLQQRLDNTTFTAKYSGGKTVNTAPPPVQGVLQERIHRGTITNGSP